MGSTESWEPLELPSPPKRWRWRRRPEPEAMDERVIAIGDIHGRWDLFNAMIQAIDGTLKPLAGTPTRILVLGDFIDRGPASRTVVDQLRVIQDRYPSVLVLQGNHEAAMLAAARGDGDAQAMWMTYGGLATLASYGVAPRWEGEDALSFGARLSEGVGGDVLDWLDQLPLSYRSGRYFFCHAGIRPGVPINRQFSEDLLWIRDEFIDDDREHDAVIVHGHTISDAIDVRHNRIGVDTGAYRTGILSAVILSETENWRLSVSLGAQG